MSWSDFHFLRPAWLAALPLLWLLALWLARRRDASTQWAALVDTPLLAALQLEGSQRGGRSPWPWLGLAWTVAALALAGPSWQQDKAPAFRGAAATVVVLDLSPSMNAADLAPDRLTRARYAVEDLLTATHEGRVALVVFADDAYTVTPLTDDAETVRGLLKSLTTDLMPVAGDHVAPALKQAGELLRQAPAGDKSVIVVTDGFDDPAAAFAAATTLRSQGIQVHTVAVGTAQGAPVPDSDGGFVSDGQHRPVLARTDFDRLSSLAHSGGGNAVSLNRLPALTTALTSTRPGSAPAADGDEHELTHWRDAGGWLLPPLLLLGAALSRRGWLP